MRRRARDKDEPLWVSALDDVAVVEKFKLLTENPVFDYACIGRYVVDLRKRLLPILVDGLASKPTNAKEKRQ